MVYALEVLACLQNDIFAAAVLSQPQSADFTADFFDAWLGHNGDLAAFQQLSGWLNLRVVNALPVKTPNSRFRRFAAALVTWRAVGWVPPGRLPRVG